MNTVEELVVIGFPESTARRMIDSYSKHIGELHGCNKITDVRYIGDHAREVSLECTLCGAKYTKVFKNSSNKWNELRSTCSCQTMVKPVSAGVVKNDDPRYLGQIYGDFKVVSTNCVSKPNPADGTRILWDCECIHCGEYFPNQAPATIKHGKHCKCQAWQKEIGKRYGRLTVVGEVRKNSGKNKKAYAVCNCDCGRTIDVQFSNLRAGKTKSCGCIQEEYSEKARSGRSEARTKSPLYSTWSGMKARCFNKNSNAYGNYGGRGITVCDEWLGPEGFDRFEKWSYDNGYRPDSGLSLDRINSKGNYEPSNCRYTTVFVQNVNQRKPLRKPIRYYEIDGESKTLKQWCSVYGISEVAVRYRMDTLKMDMKTALTTPKTRKGNIFAGKQAKERVAELNRCNSYIEANLYLAFTRTTSDYELVPQYKIGRYEVDFIVDGTNIVIECDGHDIHKTKDQIRNDNRRERELIRMGYTVVRFSGSEINEDPDGCCEELIQTIRSIDAHRKTDTGQEGIHDQAAS